MAVEPGIPETLAEFEEFGRRRFSSGLDSKEGTNVFVVSGSAVGGGGTGGTTVAKISGETVIAILRTSGGDAPSAGGGADATKTPLAVLVVSGSIVGGAAPSDVHVQSGAVELYASGMGRITAKSGSLDPNVIPLHVLVTSGSVVGSASVSVSSGLAVLISGQAVLCACFGP